MKNILYKLVILLFCSTSVYSNEPNCSTTFSALKPDCNFIGKSAKKLKSISENNKTIDKTLENKGILKKDRKKNLSLKELNEKYKPIKLGNPKK
jgi:hypothetical protein